MDHFWSGISEQLKPALGSTFVVYSAERLIGGDINDVYKLITSTGNFCIKINDNNSFPDMFEKEAKGLKLLKEKSSFSVPEPIHFGYWEDHAYLLLSFIDSASKGKDFWRSFGVGLAELHLNSNDSFGLDHDNYIGSLVQKNEFRHSWVDFYYYNRLIPQIEMGIKAGHFSRIDVENANHFYHQLHSLIPHEKPALLHGDLWSGNIMTDEKGKPTIIDPAVYYGHREMDLAMTKLFGGFNHELYDHYNEKFPLEKNWQDRIEIFNLYPILVHANLFGGGYVTQVKGILNKFG